MRGAIALAIISVLTAVDAAGIAKAFGAKALSRRVAVSEGHLRERTFQVWRCDEKCHAVKDASSAKDMRKAGFESSGSAVLIDEQGHFLTAAHNLHHGEESEVVVWHDEGWRECLGDYSRKRRQQSYNKLYDGEIALVARTGANPSSVVVVPAKEIAALYEPPPKPRPATKRKEQDYYRGFDIALLRARDDLPSIATLESAMKKRLRFTDPEKGSSSTSQSVFSGYVSQDNPWGRISEPPIKFLGELDDDVSLSRSTSFLTAGQVLQNNANSRDWRRVGAGESNSAEVMNGFSGGPVLHYLQEGANGDWSGGELLGVVQGGLKRVVDKGNKNSRVASTACHGRTGLKSVDGCEDRMYWTNLKSPYVQRLLAGVKPSDKVCDHIRRYWSPEEGDDGQHKWGLLAGVASEGFSLLNFLLDDHRQTLESVYAVGGYGESDNTEPWRLRGVTAIEDPYGRDDLPQNCSVLRLIVKDWRQLARAFNGNKEQKLRPGASDLMFELSRASGFAEGLLRGAEKPKGACSTRMAQASAATSSDVSLIAEPVRAAFSDYLFAELALYNGMFAEKRSKSSSRAFGHAKEAYTKALTSIGEAPSDIPKEVWTEEIALLKDDIGGALEGDLPAHLASPTAFRGALLSGLASALSFSGDAAERARAGELAIQALSLAPDDRRAQRVAALTLRASGRDVDALKIGAVAYTNASQKARAAAASGQRDYAEQLRLEADYAEQAAPIAGMSFKQRAEIAEAALNADFLNEVVRRELSAAATE
ncbi:MAG: hypothetical protein AAF668_14810 [Pseudomonadota bacterium]